MGHINLVTWGFDLHFVYLGWKPGLLSGKCWHHILVISWSFMRSGPWLRCVPWLDFFLMKMFTLLSAQLVAKYVIMNVSIEKFPQGMVWGLDPVIFAWLASFVPLSCLQVQFSELFDDYCFILKTCFICDKTYGILQKNSLSLGYFYIFLLNKATQSKALCLESLKS